MYFIMHVLCRGMSARGGVSSRGVSAWEGCASGLEVGVSQHAMGADTPPVDRQTPMKT